MAKRILKKDLEARIKKLEADRAIAVEYLTKLVQKSDNWKETDDVLHRMGLMGMVTDADCPPNVIWTAPRHLLNKRPEYYF